jgi:sarcosine oxidase, subunit gamma
MPEPVSVLSGRRPAGYVGIEDTGLRGQVTLKGELGGRAMAGAVRELVGLKMPGVRQVMAGQGNAAVWMAPDEVLLLMPYADAPGAVARAGEVLKGRHHMALDVSDARVVLRLTGAAVGEVLAKGAPTDLSDRACPPGSARRTHLGGMAVAFWRLDAETWEIVAFRSYAHHLVAWLEDAARPGAEVGY